MTFPSLCYLLTLYCFINCYRHIKLLPFSHPFLSTRFLRYLPNYKCTCCTHHKHNSLPRLLERTPSAPIRLSSSTVVFGHRAILLGWGGGGRRGMAAGFILEQTHVTYPSRELYLITLRPCFDRIKVRKAWRTNSPIVGRGLFAHRRVLNSKPA